MKTGFHVGVVFIGLGLAWLAGGCQRAPGGKIDLDTVEIRVGIADLVRRERWSRILLTAGAVEGAFEGEVVVSGLHTDGKSSDERFSHPFDVSTTPKTIEIPFRPVSGWEKVVVSFRGRSSTSSVAVLPNFVVMDPVMVIGIGAVPVELAAGFTESSEARVQTGVLGADDMPRTSRGYDIADVVVVYGDEILGADQDQIVALNEWVRGGGVVVGVPTLIWPGQIDGTLAGMFGVDDGLQAVDGATLRGRGNAVEYKSGAGRTLLLLSLGAGASIQEDPIAERAWSKCVRYVEAQRSR